MSTNGRESEQSQRDRQPGAVEWHMKQNALSNNQFWTSSDSKLLMTSMISYLTCGMVETRPRQQPIKHGTAQHSVGDGGLFDKFILVCFATLSTYDTIACWSLSLAGWVGAQMTGDCQDVVSTRQRTQGRCRPGQGLGMPLIGSCGMELGVALKGSRPIDRR